MGAGCPPLTSPVSPPPAHHTSPHIPPLILHVIPTCTSHLSSHPSSHPPSHLHITPVMSPLFCLSKASGDTPMGTLLRGHSYGDTHPYDGPSCNPFQNSIRAHSPTGTRESLPKTACHRFQCTSIQSPLIACPTAPPLVSLFHLPHSHLFQCKSKITSTLY